MRHKIINAGMVFKIVITLIVCVGITVVIVLSRRNKDERDAVFLKEVTTAIQKGQDLNAPVEGEIKDYTLLHLAVLSNQYDAVKLLVEHGVDLNVRDSIGATPLHRGVQRGFFEISKLLIQSGADIEAVDSLGQTPIYFAACNTSGSSGRICQLLMDSGARIDVVDNEGSGPLKMAVFIDNMPVVKLLLKNGADINARSNSGATVLHLAANGGNKRMVKFLIKAGADVNVRDESGHTPLWKAQNGYHEISSSKLEAVAEIIKANGGTL